MINQFYSTYSSENKEKIHKKVISINLVTYIYIEQTQFAPAINGCMSNIIVIEVQRLLPKSKPDLAGSSCLNDRRGWWLMTAIAFLMKVNHKEWAGGKERDHFRIPL
jgi:hypothetical protein